MIIIVFFFKKVPNRPFLLLGRGLDFFPGVTVGLLGFEVGVGPSFLGLGLSSVVWFFNHISKKYNYLRGWRKIRQGLALGVWGRPLGLGLALPSLGLGLALRVGPRPKRGKGQAQGRMGGPEAQPKGEEGEGPGPILKGRARPDPRVKEG